MTTPAALAASAILARALEMLGKLVNPWTVTAVIVVGSAAFVYDRTTIDVTVTDIDPLLGDLAREKASPMSCTIVIGGHRVLAGGMSGCYKPFAGVSWDMLKDRTTLRLLLGCPDCTIAVQRLSEPGSAGAEDWVRTTSLGSLSSTVPRNNAKVLRDLPLYYTMDSTGSATLWLPFENPTPRTLVVSASCGRTVAEAVALAPPVTVGSNRVDWLACRLVNNPDDGMQWFVIRDTRPPEGALPTLDSYEAAVSLAPADWCENYAPAGTRELSRMHAQLPAPPPCSIVYG